MVYTNAETKISVVTATRNARTTISALYDSLARQSHGNFEWVVIDACSDDGTVDLLQDFANRSPWVRFVSEPDFGFYHALNKALALANGTYYVVAGADDLFEADALANYVGCAVETGADVVLARVSRGGKIVGGFHPEKSWISHARVFAGSHSVGMLFRKQIHNRFGLYSRRFPLLADGYFLKLLLHSGSVKFVEAQFVAGTFAEGGMSAVNKLQTLAESWQIQMLTERSQLFQTLLFLGKLLVQYGAVREELRARKKTQARN